MKKKHIFNALAAAVASLGIGSSAHAQQTVPEGFSFVDKALSAFTFENDQPGWYQGSFSYDGVTYNPQGGDAFDLTTLSDGYNRIPEDPVGVGGAVYVFYKQQYSTVVGNIVKGNADRSFVKAVAGELSTALPASGSYTYNGTVFNHIEGTQGTVTYTISDGGEAGWKGSGSVDGITGKRPPTVGGDFTIQGTLDEVDITVADDKVATVTGAASLTLTAVDTSVTEKLKGVLYDLGVYGPNAEEIAGRIYHGDLQSRVGGYGFAASR